MFDNDQDLMLKLKDRRKFFEGTSRQTQAGNDTNLIIKRIERQPSRGPVDQDL